GTAKGQTATTIGHLFKDNEYRQSRQALAITTGAEKLGGPKLITASVPGRGAGNANGQVPFEPLKENPRAALLLANNVVYLTWGSSCDVDPYHGWVMACDPQSLAQNGALHV